jgi:hypothetical protein
MSRAYKIRFNSTKRVQISEMYPALNRFIEKSYNRVGRV